MSRCVAIGGRGLMRFRLAMAVARPNILKAEVLVENSIGSESLLEQIRAVEAERDALLAAVTNQSVGPAADAARASMALGRSSLRSSGLDGLSRQFDNRRQVAAYAGLAPTPWQSGSVNREQGISQSGKQPATTDNDDFSSPGSGYAISRDRRSTLSFQDRNERNGGRRRKTPIVALARKLLVALWKYVSAESRHRRRDGSARLTIGPLLHVIQYRNPHAVTSS